MNKIYLPVVLFISIILCGCPGDTGNIGDVSGEAAPVVTESKPLRVCSFNIQFLGSSRARDDAALSKILGL